MSEPPDDRSPELERFVDAISEGDPVEWEKEAARLDLDPKILKALRLIDTVSRVHRSGEGSEAPERTWGT